MKPALPSWPQFKVLLALVEGDRLVEDGRHYVLFRAGRRVTRLTVHLLYQAGWLTHSRDGCPYEVSDAGRAIVAERKHA